MPIKKIHLPLKVVPLIYKSPEYHVSIYGSEDAFVRILYNVIGNALKFATDVTVCLQMDKSNIILSIEDNGPSVPDDMSLNELFRRRVQADNQDMSRTQQGSGLGLAIVYELVHQTGGDVTLKNLSPSGFGVYILWGR
ncbi:MULTISPECIES: sensor histidine kinase [Cysteiniphilum]|uniref:sensor histidine kinase n=1 Tax=Cysteiniphilum TaxID=2056696 RepID=UPI0017847C44|nr:MULTISPECIES: ATP-binding protein [Cysteiniphilum]